MRVESQHLRAASIRAAQPLDALDGGRFARSVETHHAEDLPFVDVEGDIVYSNGCVVDLMQPFGLYDDLAFHLFIFQDAPIRVGTSGLS